MLVFVIIVLLVLKINSEQDESALPYLTGGGKLLKINPKQKKLSILGNNQQIKKSNDKKFETELHLYINEDVEFPLERDKVLLDNHDAEICGQSKGIKRFVQSESIETEAFDSNEKISLDKPFNHGPKSESGFIECTPTCLFERKRRNVVNKVKFKKVKNRLSRKNHMSNLTKRSNLIIKNPLTIKRELHSRSIEHKSSFNELNTGEQNDKSCNKMDLSEYRPSNECLPQVNTNLTFGQINHEPTVLFDDYAEDDDLGPSKIEKTTRLDINTKLETPITTEISVTTTITGGQDELLEVTTKSKDSTYTNLPTNTITNTVSNSIPSVFSQSYSTVFTSTVSSQLQNTSISTKVGSTALFTKSNATFDQTKQATSSSEENVTTEYCISTFNEAFSKNQKSTSISNEGGYQTVGGKGFSSISVNYFTETTQTINKETNFSTETDEYMKILKLLTTPTTQTFQSRPTVNILSTTDPSVAYNLKDYTVSEQSIRPSTTFSEHYKETSLPNSFRTLYPTLQLQITDNLKSASQTEPHSDQSTSISNQPTKTTLEAYKEPAKLIPENNEKLNNCLSLLCEALSKLTTMSSTKSTSIQNYNSGTLPTSEEQDQKTLKPPLNLLDKYIKTETYTLLPEKLSTLPLCELKPNKVTKTRYTFFPVGENFKSQTPSSIYYAFHNNKTRREQKYSLCFVSGTPSMHKASNNKIVKYLKKLPINSLKKTDKSTKSSVIILKKEEEPVTTSTHLPIYKRILGLSHKKTYNTDSSTTLSQMGYVTPRGNKIYPIRHKGGDPGNHYYHGKHAKKVHEHANLPTNSVNSLTSCSTKTTCFTTNKLPETFKPFIPKKRVGLKETFCKPNVTPCYSCEINDIKDILPQNLHPTNLKLNEQNTKNVQNYMYNNNVSLNYKFNNSSRPLNTL